MADTHEIRIGRYFPAVTVPIDSDAGAVAIAVRARRLTRGELLEFAADLSAVFGGGGEVAKRLTRRPDGEEQERDAAGAFVISDETILRRRLAELPAGERAAVEAAQRAEVLEVAEAAGRLVERFLEVAPSLPDGTRQRVIAERPADGEGYSAGEEFEVKTGADLVSLFGGYPPAISTLAAVVVGENLIAAEKKTRSRSRRVSSTGSPRPEEPGGTRAETADDVATPGCAASAGAGQA